jgi:hypothetical protein
MFGVLYRQPWQRKVDPIPRDDSADEFLLTVNSVIGANVARD